MVCFKACQYQADLMFSYNRPKIPHSGAILTKQVLSAYSCHAQTNSATYIKKKIIFFFWYLLPACNFENSPFLTRSIPSLITLPLFPLGTPHCSVESDGGAPNSPQDIRIFQVLPLEGYDSDNLCRN